jgi:glucose-6-phosphate 1-dehydrogenase
VGAVTSAPDVLRGDATLSIRDDEAEESWAIVEPILARWAEARPPLIEYPAGSGGPRIPATDGAPRSAPPDGRCGAA